MIFILARELFGDDSRARELLSILWLGSSARHVVLVEVGQHYDAWLERRTASERAWVSEAVTDALRRHAHPEKVCVKVVTAAHSNWRATPPELSPDDAVVLAHAPLRLVLEDFEDDAQFICWIGRAVDDPNWRRIDHAMRHGWIEVVHGGGNGSMLRLVRALDDEGSALPWGMLDARGAHRAPGLTFQGLHVPRRPHRDGRSGDGGHGLRTHQHTR